MTNAKPTNILEALNLAELSPEEQEEMLLDLNDLIFRGTLVRLIERMDAKTKKDFDALMDSDPTEEAVEDFLSARVPNSEGAVAEAMQQLTNDILAATKS